jgi:hypothetical protein
MALLTLCVGLVTLFDEYTAWSQIYGTTVIGGAGLGCMFSSAIIALQASSEPRDVAVVTGLGNFSRILGGALGVAVSSAILNSSLAQDLPPLVPAEVAQNVLASSEYVRHGCPAEYVEVVIACYINALRLIWYIMTGMCGFGFCLSLLLKSKPIPMLPASKAPAINDDDSASKMETPPDSPSLSNDVIYGSNENDINESVVAIDMKPAKETFQPHLGADMNRRN